MSSSSTDLRDAAGSRQADAGSPGRVHPATPAGSPADGPRATDAGRPADDAVLMPRMGTSVAEGTIVAWHVAVGDAVVRDQVLCEITSDKVDAECPAWTDGVVAEILASEGETVETGAVIARLAPTGGADLGAAPSAAGDTGATSVPADASASGPAHDADPVAPADARSARRRALRRSSPVAARLAAERGVALDDVVGTGRDGRITKRDVLQAAEAPAPAPMHTESPYRPDPSIPVAGAAVPTPAEAVPVADGSPPGPHAVGSVPTDLGGTPVPLSRMRRAIGDAVRRSLDTAAHCTTVVECDMSRVERERRELGLTALPLVAHAAIATLRDFPALNATSDGGTVTRHDDRVHLGIAVSLGEDGLIAPVIHDAQDLSVEGLARRIRDVATRAREGRLEHDEVRGGTFTLTNPGAAGAVIATPVINLPQVAILDLEAIVRRPVVLTDADGGESIGIRPMVHLCLGWDHRALDGLYAAQFLTALRGRIED